MPQSSEIFSDVGWTTPIHQGHSTSSKARSRPRKSAVVPAHVAENRSHMGESGVLIASFLIDSASRTLMQNVHLESRGFLLPTDVRRAHAALVKRARQSYEVTLKDIPDIEDKELSRLIKGDLERTCDNEVSRTPLVIVIFHTL